MTHLKSTSIVPFLSVFLLIAAMPFLVRDVRALTVQYGVQRDGANSSLCDAVTWVDRGGRNRTAWLVQKNGLALDSLGKYVGGTIDKLEYSDGSATTTCRGGNEFQEGFGMVVNHGNEGGWGVSHASWLDERANGYEGPDNKFAFLGDHLAVYEFRCKMGCEGKSTTPYYWLIKQYVFRDGEDQFQYILAFDTSPIGGDPNLVVGMRGSDSRSPYVCWDWDGDGQGYNIISGYQYGTTHVATLTLQLAADTSQVSMNSPFDATTPYNLCPYVMGWDQRNGHNAEMGVVQTRLNTKHRCGGLWGKSNGTSGILQNFAHDFQLSEFQSWRSGRFAWDAASPSAIAQYGVTPGSENYSLTVMMDPKTADGMQRIVAEANAAQNAGTSLTVATGKVATYSLEGPGLKTAAVWDKPGFDQVYRAWAIEATNNVINATLTLVSGASLVNPTFELTNYTSPNKPTAVTRAGASLSEGTGYYASVDTAAQKCWITFLSTFSGATTVTVTGSADSTGINVQSFSVSPNGLVNSTATTLTFAATITDDGSISAATLDLSSLGGSASAALAKTGNSFTASYTTAPGMAQGTKLVTLKAADNAGHVRYASVMIMAQKPDMILYRDDTPKTTAGWVPSGTITETSGGAFEGTKQLVYNYDGNQQYPFGHFTFDTIKDIRGYGYLNMAIKGPTAGTAGIMLHAMPGGYVSPEFNLGSVAGWQMVSIPIGCFGTAYLDSIAGFAIAIHGSTSACQFSVDDISLTSYPFVGGSLPTAISPHPLVSMPGRFFVRSLVYGRRVLFTGSGNGSLSIHTIAGERIKMINFNSHHQGIQQWTAKTAGVYIIRAANGTEESTQRLVIR